MNRDRQYTRTRQPVQRLNARQQQTTADRDQEALNGAYEDVWPPRLPTSTRRYTSVQTTPRFQFHLDQVTNIPRRASAQQAPLPKRQPRPNQNSVQSPDVIYAQPSRQDTQEDAYYSTRGERVRLWLGRALIVLGILLIIMLGGFLAVNALGNWWTNQTNTWTYGYPRTYQTDANVGHGTEENPMSHFIAQNLDKHIIVIEIPGDNPSKSEIYLAPTLIGDGQEFTPVTLSFEDVNHDPQHPALVIHVLDSRFVFLNQKVNGVWKFVPAPNQT